VEAFRDRLISTAPERILTLLSDFISYKVECEKLKRFATAMELDRGFVKGMESIVTELHGITTEIQNRRKEGQNG